MAATTKQRNNIVDILKALGIISVIIGHAGGTIPFVNVSLPSFVYTYHLMVFFFALGLCYSEDKYAAHPDQYIGKRIFGTIKYYIGYNTIFVLLHNLLGKLGLISASPYTPSDMFIWIASGSVASTNESMLGAFWFLPFYMVSCTLLTFCMYLASLLPEKASKFKNMLQATLCISCGAFGLFFNCKGMYLAYHIQTSFLAVPVIYSGYLCRGILKNLNIWLSRIGTVICACIMIFLIKKFHIAIELSANVVNSYLSFYPITAVGILFCVLLSNCIHYHAWLSRAFAFIGRNSFHYMALHFLTFKLVDLVVSYYRGSSIETRMMFPTSYNDLWFVYIIASIMMISVGLLGYEQLKKH